MESDRQLVYQWFHGMLFDSQPITIEQKGVLISLMHTQEMRRTFADILAEVGTSVRVIKSEKVLKLLSDVIRFVLTLIVHEDFEEFRLVWLVLDSSQHIYFVTPKKRKLYLYQMIADHGIWSDFNHWRNLVWYTMRLKIDEAIRRKKINGTSLQNIKAATSKLMQTKDEKFKHEMKDH
jgi:hypothetical protein